MSKELIKQLEKTFEANRNDEFAKGMKDYMRGQYEFFGIKMSPQRQLSKEFFQAAKALSHDELLTLSKHCLLETSVNFIIQLLKF